MGIRLPPLSGFSIEPFRSERSWTFDAPVEELWERLGRVEEYPNWWPWLRDFEPAGGFEEGASWRCTVAPPLPYVVRFTVEMQRVEAFRIESTVSGDIRGTATLKVDESDGGRRSVVELRSRLEPTNPVLRGFGRVARPLVEWGHDWVLDQGCQQFKVHTAATPEERN